jgi:hypothetical protein
VLIRQTIKPMTNGGGIGGLCHLALCRGRGGVELQRPP